MKRLFVFLIFGLFVFLTPGTSSAQTQFLNNWTIDIDGAGGFDPVTINEFLDIVGPAYVVNSFTTAPPSVGDSGKFDDFAVFVSSQHDFGQTFPWFFDNELTGIFQGSGTVEVGGPLVFAAGGTLEIYADLGKAFAFATDTTDADSSIYGANEQTLIAAFEVEGGDGLVDPTGVPNGQITVIFKATFLAPGVWVDGNGTDLSTMTSLVRGFSTTNASFVENLTSAMITDLAGEFAGVSPSNTPPGDMFVGANGQFRLFVEEEEEEPGQCRMTGGNATVSPAIGTDGLETWTYNFKKLDKDFWITTGGQIGAPSVESPRGHWTHTQQGGAEGSFTFHSGTSSAPDGTEISTIECADPGWCVQARCAPYKQIFWTGVGNFAKQGFDAAALGNCVVADIPRKGGTLHFYRAMVGDFGENKRPTREDALVDENPETCDWFARLQAAGWPGPPGPYVASSAVFLDSKPDDPKPLGFGDKGGQICDACPDYYQIEIHCTTDPNSEIIYTFEGFIDSGNYQIHPETGEQCPPTPELVPELN
jgi:hypothetical protein